MKTIKIEITFGIGFDKLGRALDPTLVATFPNRLLRLACVLFGGGTLIAHTGAWLDGDNLVVEPGYTLVIVSPDKLPLGYITGFIKENLDQSAVLVVETDAISALV